MNTHDHKKTITIQPSVLYFGTPVVLITTLNPDGTTNITPISSVWALGYRVVLGMATDGRGFNNLKRERTCVINVPVGALWPAVERLAPTTGEPCMISEKLAMGYQYVADKFNHSGLTPVDSDLVGPKKIAECPLQLEASISQIYYPSKQEEGFEIGIIEAHVLKVHAHEDIVINGTHHIDTMQFHPLLYVFRHYFTTDIRLGATFKSEYV